MNLCNKNLFIGVSVLLIFISIGVFGLLQFNHTNKSMEAPMVNCPYAQNGYAVCANNLNHIDAWHQFSNVTFPLLFSLSFLLLGIVLYFLNKQNFLKQKQYFYKWKYYLDDKNTYTPSRKIIEWLSLFINSPSLSYQT